MPRLTIAAATVNSPHWNRLFVQSVRKFTRTPYELLIIDNGSTNDNKAWLREQADVRLVENEDNVGHGGAMDQATSLCQTRFVTFLDIDAHVQREGWETDLIEIYETTPNCRLIGVIGPSHKPLHPPLFFFEPEFIRRHGLTWKYQPGVALSTDTAQKTYWDIKELGYEVVRLEKGQKLYPDVDVDEIVIAGASSIAHFWYGSRFQENGVSPKTELDGIPVSAYIDKKHRLFANPFVKEIMAYRA